MFYLFPGLENWYIYIYEFQVRNHHFTIIYTNNVIYYVDYYVEARWADNPNVFCVMQLTHKQWHEFYTLVLIMIMKK